ncbi:MAG: PAS domain-containing protein [Holophagales bacterium]|jgi:transcriptional regulator with PAS, ATPase and Fis domain|nr:PAS domain-containing protein [Holophagales bacterium]
MQNWIEEFNAAITVTDRDFVVIYMNNKAAATFEKWGGSELIGKNLSNCHKERSMAIMRQILETGTPNTYTIEKNGIKKMVFQTPWKKSGAIAGLVEISFEIPWDMEHYVRN